MTAALVLAPIGLNYDDILRRTPREVYALCDEVSALTQHSERDSGGRVPMAL